jgi:protein gp37
MYTGTGEGQEHRKLHVQQEKDTPRIVILQTLEDLLHYHFDVVERATELTRGSRCVQYDPYSIVSKKRIRRARIVRQLASL